MDKQGKWTCRHVGDGYETAICEVVNEHGAIIATTYDSEAKRIVDAVNASESCDTLRAQRDELRTVLAACHAWLLGYALTSQNQRAKRMAEYARATLAKVKS